MNHLTVSSLPAAIAQGLEAGTLAPYLGPGLLSLCEGAAPPAHPLALATALTAKVAVPGKIKNRLTAAAQFIENFKHRKTLVKAMNEIFALQAEPSALHRWLAALPAPLIVDTWYDDTLRSAVAAQRSDWIEAQGLAQSEHFGTWYGWYDSEGKSRPDPAMPRTLLYKPWGGHAPAGNYLISDSDFVEVLTEIDIQTPIPALVQERRAALGFVFLGCRFNDQLPRAFARQILKRSAGPHYAVLAEEPTRMEARFLAEQGITRIALPLEQVAAALCGSTPALA
ncbi:SIR2 family protein [Rubrivivax sp. A210]|uniref:SIR2 family NAD-dependent protein deacylase n=1 Tax=Rubrivivax sp. A210 TaxID=2772301 RepID=UPI001917D94A|nr:SIR2 family protein [Rubrivivax sp. A210]CAD5371944.1 SIR2 family protein [Rubrivivax sp. A210]